MRLTDEQRELAEPWIGGVIACIRDQTPWVLNYMSWEDAISLGCLVLTRCAANHSDIRTQFSTYLYNSLINEMRWMCGVIRARHAKNKLLGQHIDICDEYTEDYDKGIERQERADQLREIIQRSNLTDLEQNVIRLHLDGLPGAEIARRNNVSQQAVFSAKKRAIGRMRRFVRVKALAAKSRFMSV